MPYYMVECRIEIEADNQMHAEAEADALGVHFNDSAPRVGYGAPELFIDNVRLTEGEVEPKETDGH